MFILLQYLQNFKCGLLPALKSRVSDHKGCFYEIKAEVDDQERIMLDVAAGKLDFKDFTTWVRNHIVKRSF